ncbi:MAG: MFS transporter [Bdellovibrionales bacterium]|nr:MFS transporter [Bdellovibrionales bacterium]
MNTPTIPPAGTSANRSAVTVIFTTVFLDLIGFGMIIPLVGIYGKHFGAGALGLAVLGSIYSIMQFFFSPIWGRLSDRVGRRPIILMSLAGSVISYGIFAFAHSFPILVVSRAFAGIFAANISTAQAYMADVTSSQDRAKGMGLIGAAFGIGFTLGPPVGGISAGKIGLWAPGVIAASFCLLNLILAYFRLKESLPAEIREKNKGRPSTGARRAQLETLLRVSKDPALFLPVISTFFTTFAFSNLEQVFSLLIQNKFTLATEEAGYKTGMVLMWSGLLGVIVQGGLIRKLVPKYGEVKLAISGFFIQGAAMILFSHSPTYGAFFLAAIPLALGSGLITPTLAALVSKRSSAHEQGAVIGLKEGLSSLARVFGPFCGLLAFGLQVHFPFYIAAFTVFILGFVWLSREQISSPQTSS